MVTRLILDSHPASTLKKEISKTNIKGYSKMSKKQLIDVMMANKERFGHIKKKEYVPPKRTKKAEPPKKEPPKKPAPKKVMAKPKADTEPKRPSEPKRPAPKKTAEEERRDKLNKMNPLELFSQLPDVAKRNVERFTGTELGDKFRKLKEIGGINQKKKEMNEIQKKFLKWRYYSLGNFDDKTLKAIRKEKNGSEILKALSDYMDKEIKKGRKTLEEKERKQDKRLERDTTKPTLINILEEVIDSQEWGEHLQNSVENEFERMTYFGEYNYNTATEAESERMVERVDNKMYKGLKKETRTRLQKFLKNKKFKTAKEGADAFRKANPISDIEFSF